MKQRPLVELLMVWNRATDPRALRTDHQHRRYQQLARAAMRRIDARWVEGRDWRMSDHTGRLYSVAFRNNF